MRRKRNQRGASAVEYALIVAAIAFIIIPVLIGTRLVIREVFLAQCNQIGDCS